MSKAQADSRTQRQRVVEAIQKRILDGDLKPGDPLRQIPLSKEYGVSQSVIRESLQTLEQYGLVTGVDKLGFVVRKLDRQELIDAYRVREVLEGLAARLCSAKRAATMWNGSRTWHTRSMLSQQEALVPIEATWSTSFISVFFRFPATKCFSE